jgi:hypothetical protein
LPPFYRLYIDTQGAAEHELEQLYSDYLDSVATAWSLLELLLPSVKGQPSAEFEPTPLVYQIISNTF